MLLYFRLRKKNHIDVFEKSNIGGAWRIGKINGQRYTKHNNVIVALNEEEEDFIEPINKELEDLGCEKTKPSGTYEMLPDYVPKNIFIHDLSGLYSNFKKKCRSLIYKKVNTLKSINKKAYLNNVEYDHIFIPCCFDIKKIFIDKKKIDTQSQKSISHHLTIVYRKTEFPNISYTENFDNVFDRAYFKEKKNCILFTGRIRRNYKKLKPSELIETSDKLKKMKTALKKLKLNKYHHNIIDEKVLRNLKKELLPTNIMLIETRQFVNSYKLLNY